MTASIPPEAAAGGRPVVIALHCSGSSGRQWQALEAGLGDHCAVLAPDLIGCASVGHWGGDRAFGLDDEASTIIAFIDGWSGPVHLVGHSYGGGVALQVAIRRSSRIASLSLYEPSAFHLLTSMGPEGKAAFGEIQGVALAVQNGILTGAYRAAAEIFVDYWNGSGAWERMKPHVQAELLRYLPKAVLDFRALFAGAVQLDGFRRLDVPMLIMHGERAPRPTALIARKLHAVARRGRLRTIRGAGHMGPLTHAEAVAAAIREHILAGSLAAAA
jgi:pimeloyl-ACP methyl ester carboxylesterase